MAKVEVQIGGRYSSNATLVIDEANYATLMAILLRATDSNSAALDFSVRRLPDSERLDKDTP